MKISGNGYGIMALTQDGKYVVKQSTSTNYLIGVLYSRVYTWGRYNFFYTDGETGHNSPRLCTHVTDKVIDVASGIILQSRPVINFIV